MTEGALAESKSSRRYRFGVDIGGTFTDLVVVDERGGVMLVGKTLTTPRDPSVGVLTGLTRMLAEQGLSARDIEVAVHATTLITNAIIERKGAKTALITTEGFKDVLEIGRELRYDLYDLFLEMPKPLVPRQLRREVRERVRKDGRVSIPLDRAQVETVVQELIDQGVESIAVCFLHSYINDEHELAVERQIGEKHPGMFVSVSSRVAREIREYERTSTTVANAYVQPLADKYLDRLAGKMEGIGFGGSLYMMLSNGGIASLRSARELPIRLVESGPAAGALVGGFYGGLVGERNVLAFDMGGTTAKACMVEDGQPMTTYSFEAARVHRFRRGSGLPLKVPAIELMEIGAGGGSIAHLDRMGLLKVGPESAGAEPGPACYGRGGVDPTVTDADLLLGYLNPDYFLGGEMRLDLEAARRAVREKVAGPLNVGEVEAAWGIHEIVNENMAGAARVHIAEKGRDPRSGACPRLPSGQGAPTEEDRVPAGGRRCLHHRVARGASQGGPGARLRGAAGGDRLGEAAGHLSGDGGARRGDPAGGGGGSVGGVADPDGRHALRGPGIRGGGGGSRGRAGAGEAGGDEGVLRGRLQDPLRADPPHRGGGGAQLAAVRLRPRN